ncbi:MAG TPA: hypothetical protein VF587_07850 [Solirubrobacteraceae bacterium]|jgi:hypothetical protein
MKSIRFSLRSAVLALLALATLAPSALASSVPLEVRPSQGPSGSSAILHANGFTAGETVRVYVDGEQVRTDVAEGGTATRAARMPGEQGVHRIVLKGVSSQTTAAGTFTTTAASDPARPAFLVSPKPLGASGDPTWPYAAEYHVVNFPSEGAIEGLYPWSSPDGAGGCNFEGYFSFRIGRADHDGTFEGDDIWRFGCMPVITLGVASPWAADEAATVVAADALVQPVTGYDATRRVRAVPSVSFHNGPIFLLGTGFTPGGAVSLEEQWVSTPTAAGNAGPDGSVVTRENVGVPPEYEQEYTLTQGAAKASAAAWRQEGATIPPTAAAANDLVAPGTSTTVVGVGLAEGTATLTGRDLDDTPTAPVDVAVAADGTFQTSFAIPGGADPGGYVIDVAQGGIARAHASLAVGTAATTMPVPAARIVEPGLGVVAMQPGQAAQQRDIEVCNDGSAAATFTVADDSPNVTLAPAPGSIAPGACETVTVTVANGAPTATPEHVTITASAPGGVEATATLDRLVRSVTIDPVPTGPKALLHNPDAPFTLKGTTQPGAQVEVLAIGYGEPVRSLGWSEGADGDGDWQLIPPLPQRGTHYRFVAIPVELGLGDDRSRYPTAGGTIYGSTFLSYFEGLVRNDMTTSRTVFRGAGEPTAGVEDVFVLDPETTTDSFDGAGWLELVDTYDNDGTPNDSNYIRPDEDPREGGGMFGEGDIVVENESLVGYYAAPTKLTRRYEADAGSRAATVIDRFENTGSEDRTYQVSFVANGGAAADRTRFRLSDGTTWENPADGAILREGSAVDDQGFVALRDQDGPAGHGVGFVSWQSAPDRVRLRDGSRDEVVLDYTITVPADDTFELRHGIGAAPSDAAALSWAAGVADSTPPTLAVTNPPNTGLTTTSRSFTVSGTVTDALGTPTVDVAVVDAEDNDTVLVAPVAATVNPNGTWSAGVQLPNADGHYYLRVVADDGNGNVTQPHFRSVVLRRTPTAATGDADEITAFAAKVDAIINASDRPTSYEVEYGPTTAYGSEVNGGDDRVTGHAEVTKTLALTGLTPSTTYHYRVVATNAAGTTTGDDRTFTTLADTSPVVSELTVSERGQNSARLSGHVDPSTHPTTWWIEWGTDEDLGTETTHSAPIVAGQDVTTVLDGLLPSTTYYARLIAANESGEARGAQATFTTEPAPDDPDDPGDGGGNGGGGGGGEPTPGPSDPPPAGDPPPPADPPFTGFFPPAGDPATPTPGIARGIRLRDVLRKGLSIDFDLTGTRCEGGCPLAIQLLVDRRTARRARIAAAPRLVVVGKRTVVFRDDVRTRVTVKLTSRARKRLKRLKRLSLVVKATLTDAGGKAAVAERRLTLKR